MGANNESNEADKAQLKEQLKQIVEWLATPIDFEQLVTDGVLKKRGAWWEVLDWKRLPEHANQKVHTVATGNLVKFSKHLTGSKLTKLRQLASGLFQSKARTPSKPAT